MQPQETKQKPSMSKQLNLLFNAQTPTDKKTLTENVLLVNQDTILAMQDFALNVQTRTERKHRMVSVEIVNQDMLWEQTDSAKSLVAWMKPMLTMTQMQ